MIHKRRRSNEPQIPCTRHSSGAWNRRIAIHRAKVHEFATFNVGARSVEINFPSQLEPEYAERTRALQFSISEFIKVVADVNLWRIVKDDMLGAEGFPITGKKVEGIDEYPLPILPDNMKSQITGLTTCAIPRQPSQSHHIVTVLTINILNLMCSPPVQLFSTQRKSPRGRKRCELSRILFVKAISGSRAVSRRLNHLTIRPQDRHSRAGRYPLPSMYWSRRQSSCRRQLPKECME